MLRAQHEARLARMDQAATVLEFFEGRPVEPQGFFEAYYPELLALTTTTRTREMGRPCYLHEASIYLLKANTGDVTMTSSELDGLLPLTPVTFEILLALAEAPSHGYDIMLAVERRTGGRMSPNPGTLYRALDRMVRQGLLNAMEEGVEEGEPRRIFRLSGLGRRAAAAEAERMADQLGAARARGVLEGPSR